MQKVFVFFIVSVFLISCNTDKLKSRISELEQMNKILEDSIKKINYNKIISSKMIILPSSMDGGSKFDAMIYSQLRNINYDLYQLDTLHYAKNG